MFDITNIVTLSGCAEADVRTLLPSVLQSIRNYTNRGFITSVSILDDLVITSSNKISSTLLPFDAFIVGDTIELKTSLNNPHIYTIKAISVDLMEIETNEKTYPEEIYGYVIKLSFPITDDIIASFIRYSKSSSQEAFGVVSETLDGYSYIKESGKSNGFPKTLLSSVSHLKKLPGSMDKEYLLANYYI